MKVAIIGAGVSGLSCAHELEKHDIRPVIYERNSFIGDAYPHAGAILQIIHRPLKDAFEYFNKQLGIDVKPLNTIKNIIHYSPNKTALIKGNLGYFVKKTKDDDSFGNQIYSKLKKTEVLFNEIGDYESLSKKYDYVVIANGIPAFTEELGCWQDWLKSYTRGAVLLGDFDANTMVMWINKSYCKNGYAYLVPFDKKKASIVLVVTDVDEKEVDYYWELFLYTEKIKYSIVEEFKVEHKAGHVYPRIFGNLLFTGNAAGGIEPFLGFGLINAVIMGVSAARTIATGKDYERQVRDIMKRNLQMYHFRKIFNSLTNRDYDRIVAAMGLPGLKSLLYSTTFNAAKYGALASRLLLKRRR